MSDRSVSVSTGPTFGLASLVFIIFLVLKLANVAPVAAWSWWWVCSPLLISVAITLGIFALILCVGLVVAMLKVLFGR